MKREHDLLVHYRRIHPGTYAFTVDRGGKVTLAYDPIDRCTKT